MKSLSNLLLGPPGRRRVHVVMTLLTLLIYGLFMVTLKIMVSLGLADAQASEWLATYCLAGSFGFYLLLRSGLSDRLSKEPSLMALQNAHSVLAVVWAYTLAGSSRGVVLTILVLIVSYGMFAKSARHARMLALFSVSLLAATMAWKTQTQPTLFPVEEEVIHLAVTMIVLLGVVALSIRMSAFRGHLHRQKRELEISLERIRRLALQDDLTGLFNRRYMRMLLRSELARQQRTGQIMTLALIDLDHFKVVNDRHGHAAGDIVLRAFARNAGPCLRSTDVLARWGGEEFLLMMADTDQKEALKCLERIRTSLAQTLFDELSPGLHVTFSAGLTPCYPGESFEAVMERVDQAMYRAKEAGRDRTVSA